MGLTGRSGLFLHHRNDDGLAPIVRSAAAMSAIEPHSFIRAGGVTAAKGIHALAEPICSLLTQSMYR
ncbi:MAG: hypothetical protein IPK39_12795 [Sulfuritalea sp.]|nr:hypothetical protein [Sulfuritalea sp.]